MANTHNHVNDRVPVELTNFLKEYPELRVDKDRGKVCCCLTGHEMPFRVDAVRTFVMGKKFLKAQGDREYDYKQHEPHLVPNTKKGFQHTLFCTLTLRCVTKRPVDVERHVKGKCYTRALQRWKVCQETGEKFKPRAGKKKMNVATRREEDSGSDQGSGKAFWQHDSDDDEDEMDDGDDLDDLYPCEDFASADEEEDSDEENVSGVSAQAEANGNSDGNDSAAEDTSTVREKTNTQSSHKAVKRRKLQKLGGKKKRV